MMMMMPLHPQSPMVLRNRRAPTWRNRNWEMNNSSITSQDLHHHLEQRNTLLHQLAMTDSGENQEVSVS